MPPPMDLDDDYVLGARLTHPPRIRTNQPLRWHKHFKTWVGGDASFCGTNATFACFLEPFTPCGRQDALDRKDPNALNLLLPPLDFAPMYLVPWRFQRFGMYWCVSLSAAAGPRGGWAGAD